MAKATVRCTCNKCGETFSKILTFASRREADAWEETAAKKYDTCPACYREEKAAQEDARNACLNLPEITGVSDRQIAYATDLRRHYISTHRDEMEYGKAVMDGTEEEILAWYTDNGMTFPGDFDAARIEIIADFFPTSAKIFATAEAGKLINLLK